jgi:cytochrome P450
MTQGELLANAGTIVIAGSETSSTLLSGMIFNLLKTPHALEKLQDEIRHGFKSTSDMTFSAEAKLPYMHACIEEAFRIYPPVPITMPRYTPPAGSTIDHQFVPGNVRSLSQSGNRSANVNLGYCWREPSQCIKVWAELQGSNDVCTRTLAWG